MKILKICLTLISIVLLAQNSLAVDPPAEDVSVKVNQLWSENKVGELGTYITTLVQNYPDFVPAIIAGAFHDAAYTGKGNDAKQKLQRIQDAITATPNSYPLEIKVMLEGAKKMIDDEIAIQSANGKNQSDWMQNANPQTMRDLWGANHANIPLLIPLKTAPKTFLGP